MRNQVIFICDNNSYFTNVGSEETFESLSYHIGCHHGSCGKCTGIIFVGNTLDAATKAKILTSTINAAMKKE